MAPKKKSKPLSWFKKELDRVFSIYIRRRDKGRCYTCGVRKTWKTVHNGHYVSRTYLSTRWDERNCHAQCPGCNLFKEGAKDEYTLRLIKDYGPTILEELNKDKWKPVKLSQQWYEDKIQYYKKVIQDTWNIKV